MSHGCRNGEYELFTYNCKTYCFVNFGTVPAIINAPGEMFQWLRTQSGCRAMDESDTFYYLDEKTYMLWKLRYT